MKSISSLKNLKGKRVLVRVDCNVPVKAGKVLDDTKLRASYLTIQYLIKAGAKVILATHLGRPKGKVVAKYKVAPLAKYLSKLLKKKVSVITFAQAKKSIAKLRAGQVILLENTRFLPDEKGNKGTLGKRYADLADIFVSECFGVSHRGDASIVGPAQFLPSYAGFLLEQEIQALTKVSKNPKSPYVAIIGGAKTETKIPVIKNVLKKADQILIGGGIVNTYLAGLGYGVGASLVDAEFKKQAVELCKKKKVIKPVDVIVGDFKGKTYHIAEIGKKKHAICSKNEMILDIGPETIQLFAAYIKKAKTIVWNGAPGLFEQAPYHIGTAAIAGCVAERAKLKSVYGVIGGGETIQSMEQFADLGNIDLVSTGGGAMLEFLAGKTLPGIAALQ